MKMNSNGVSAKEMLAVISIVCMIIVVLVPTILGFIKSSENKVLVNNVITFRNELNELLSDFASNGEWIGDGSYYVMKDGNVCLGNYDKKNNKCSAEFLKIEFEGLKPNAGCVDVSGSYVSNLYNIEFNHMYVNLDKKFEYYVSEEPITKALCRQ